MREKLKGYRSEKNQEQISNILLNDDGAIH